MKPLKIVLCDFAPSLAGRPLWDVIEPPLGLMSLSSWIKRAFGSRVEVRILQARMDFSTFDQFGRLVSEIDPDLVGLRSLTFESRQIHRAAAIAKSKTGAKVIVGGPYPSSAPERIANDPNIDAVVIGEGEKTLEEIVSCILSGMEDWRNVRGICINHNGDIIHTGERPLISDLAELPMPDYDAVQLHDYNKLAGFSCSSRPRATIQFSRGCPYSCTYCHDIMKKTYRTRPPEAVFEEIEFLRREKNIRNFIFVDDLFNLHAEQAEILLRKIRDELPGLRLFFPNGLRGDRIEPGFIDLLTEAGMVEVNYALETGSPRMQKLIKKNLNISKLIEAVNITAEKDVVVGLFMMMGFPDETEEEAEMTFNALMKMPMVHFPYLNMLKIYEGTSMYREAVKKGCDMGRTASGLEESFDRFNPEFLPFSEKVVLRIRKRILRRHFFKKARLAHVLPIQRKLFIKSELERKYSTYLPKFDGMESLDRRAYSAYTAIAGPAPMSAVRY
ncbi:MAG: radical SAM protein [Candidatus Desulfatibia sp.]|uniref:B12-binding domain-containing radical SAM protein n=1 Tax=Candidatus Desulfatibia sp. TaxID=3101189 RepID=UPI002F2E7A5D